MNEQEEVAGPSPFFEPIADEMPFDLNAPAFEFGNNKNENANNNEEALKYTEMQIQSILTQLKAVLSNDGTVQRIQETVRVEDEKPARKQLTKNFRMALILAQEGKAKLSQSGYQDCMSQNFAPLSLSLTL